MRASWPETGRTAVAAGYLCCSPEDHQRFAAQWGQVAALAARLGVPSPVLFLERPRLERGPGPALAHLLRVVGTGAIRLVLVPGPWVFGPSQAEAERLRAVLAVCGARVLSAQGETSARPPTGKPS
ncbi:hypothetical protein [Kitasatospora sp. NPDC004289]